MDRELPDSWSASSRSFARGIGIGERDGIRRAALASRETDSGLTEQTVYPYHEAVGFQR